MLGSSPPAPPLSAVDEFPSATATLTATAVPPAPIKESSLPPASAANQKPRIAPVAMHASSCGEETAAPPAPLLLSPPEADVPASATALSLLELANVSASISAAATRISASTVGSPRATQKPADDATTVPLGDPVVAVAAAMETNGISPSLVPQMGVGIPAAASAIPNAMDKSNSSPVSSPPGSHPVASSSSPPGDLPMESLPVSVPPSAAGSSLASPPFPPSFAYGISPPHAPMPFLPHQGAGYPPFLMSAPPINMMPGQAPMPPHYHMQSPYMNPSAMGQVPHMFFPGMSATGGYPPPPHFPYPMPMYHPAAAPAGPPPPWMHDWQQQQQEQMQASYQASTMAEANSSSATPTSSPAMTPITSATTKTAKAGRKATAKASLRPPKEILRALPPPPVPAVEEPATIVTKSTGMPDPQLPLAHTIPEEPAAEEKAAKAISAPIEGTEQEQDENEPPRPARFISRKRSAADLLSGETEDISADADAEEDADTDDNFKDDIGHHSHRNHTSAVFVCEFDGCGKTFSRLYNLRSHQKTHTGERPYNCASCYMTFSRKHDLKRHQRIHSGTRPYLCKHCNKSFSRLDALNRHLQGSCGARTNLREFAPNSARGQIESGPTEDVDALTYAEYPRPSQ